VVRHDNTANLQLFSTHAFNTHNCNSSVFIFTTVSDECCYSSFVFTSVHFTRHLIPVLHCSGQTWYTANWQLFSTHAFNTHNCNSSVLIFTTVSDECCYSSFVFTSVHFTHHLIPVLHCSGQTWYTANWQLFSTHAFNTHNCNSAVLIFTTVSDECTLHFSYAWHRLSYIFHIWIVMSLLVWSFLYYTQRKIRMSQKSENVVSDSVERARGTKNSLSVSYLISERDVTKLRYCNLHHNRQLWHQRHSSCTVKSSKQVDNYRP